MGRREDKLGSLAVYRGKISLDSWGSSLPPVSINRPFPDGGEVVVHSLDSQVQGKEVFLNY
jgi:hypothetical protein